MVLADLTWLEVDALDRDVVFLLPTGATEQHGPHLPMDTDTCLVDAVARAVERRLADRVVLLPPLAVGASPHHLPFPGTLSLGYVAYVETLRDLAESLFRHGFRRLYVLNGHLGNHALNEVALREVKLRFPNALLAHAEYFHVAHAEMDAVMQAHGHPGGLSMGHGDEIETSLMLAIVPGRVKLSRAVDDGLSPEPPVQGLVTSFEERSEHGIAGNATVANAVLGTELLEQIVDRVTYELANFAGTITFLGSGASAGGPPGSARGSEATDRAEEGITT
ncbi:MAG: creatininase family protein [Fimbriimonadaceae bacterium]|nr:creatininase family protein [Fimbriimonadaceae bacterium]